MFPFLLNLQLTTERRNFPLGVSSFLVSLSDERYYTCMFIYRYMDKRVLTKLNGGRVVEGTLRGFDPFMNLVIDDGTEIRKTGERVQIGVSVSHILIENIF